MFGKGKIRELGDLLSDHYKKIMVITDENLVINTDIILKIESILSDHDLLIYDQVEENPSTDSIEIAREVARNKSIDLVIGLGGGSCMDAAKGIAILGTNSGSLVDYINKMEIKNDALPLICIPTTFGTGSEVTPFAVFTDRSQGTKMALVHDNIYPMLSIIDPELGYSMPRSLIIDTGLDALGHSIEAYLSTITSDHTQTIALHAIDIIVENLEKAVQKHHVSMDRMAYASMLGGLAISQASTILPHIMGYPLTIYYNIPHGRAGMILLPAFLKYLDENLQDKEKVEKITHIFDQQNGILGFLQKLGISMKLSEYGIKKSELRDFVKKVIIKDDIHITPGDVSEEDIYGIYVEAF